MGAGVKALPRVQTGVRPPPAPAPAPASAPIPLLRGSANTFTRLVLAVEVARVVQTAMPTPCPQRVLRAGSGTKVVRSKHPLETWVKHKLMHA
jgi:hypothetical protein